MYLIKTSIAVSFFIFAIGCTPPPSEPLKLGNQLPLPAVYKEYQTHMETPEGKEELDELRRRLQEAKPDS